MRLGPILRRAWIPIAVAAPALAWAQLRSPRAGGPPVASVVGVDRHTFRVGRDAGTVETTFRIANRGGTPLTLGDPSTSCGCTGAEIRPRVLAPGRESAVAVKARPLSAGTREVEILVPTNDPGKPTVRFTIAMTTEVSLPAFASSNGPVNFGPVRAGMPAETILFNTRERSGSEPWITRVDSDLPGLTLTLGRPEDYVIDREVTSRHYRVEARWETMPPLGEIRGSLRIWASTDPGVPIHTLPVGGVVRDPVSCSPSTLRFGILPGEPLPTMSLTFTTREPEFPLLVEPGPGMPPGLAFEFRGDRGRTTARISFRSRPDSSSTTPLVFKTNHPETPEIRVPLSVTATPR